MNKSDLSYLTLAAKDAEQNKPKKEDHIAKCGTFASRIDAQNGRQVFFQYECGYELDCPRCFDKRVRRVKDDIERAYSEGPIAMLWAENDGVAEDLLSDLVKKNYRKFPIADGSVVTFYKCEEGDANQVKDIDELNLSIDWNEIAKTTPKRRTSGALGIAKKSVDNDKYLGEVETQTVATNANQLAQKQAYKKATAETSNLHPTSIEELGYAITMRVKAYVGVLTSWGYDSVCSSYTQKIKSINWQDIRLYSGDYAQKMENDRRLIAVLGG
jgi:hypothetical protein